MATAYQPKIITDGLALALDAGDVKSYPGTGTTWKDRSGSDYNGTLLNGAVFNSTDKTIKLDGTDEGIDLGSDITIKTSGGWTVDSWVKYDNVPAGYNNNTSPGNFIGAESISYNSWYWSVLGSKLALWNMSPGTWRYGSTTIQANTWYNAVLVCTDSGTSYQMYLNGVAEGGNHTTYTSWSTSHSGLKIRYIGRGRSSIPRQVDGAFATTRVYDRVLTASELLQNYNATKSRFGL